MSLLAENTRRWSEHHVKPEKLAQANAFAVRALAAKEHYQHIADRVHAEGGYIPWYAIALIHERECIGGTKNLSCSIGQGSPFNVKSKIKPSNGPFESFDDAAVYNLLHSPPFAGRNVNWSGGGLLTKLEEYNGLGYARRGKSSPYIWAGTDQYVKGKYIADGVYDPEKVDPQLGVAVMLSALMAVDPSIKLDGNIPNQSVTPRKAETTVVMSSAGGILETLNALNPYYDLDWTDYSLIAAGFILIVGYVVHRIIKAKKGSV